MKDLCFKECHFFEKNSMNFVFLVDSLQLYLIDKDAYIIIKNLYREYKRHNRFEYKDTILLQELKDAGIIYTAEQLKNDKEKVQLIRDKLVIEEQSKEKVYLTNIVLQVANDCNLNCKYCYGDGGSYGRTRELMTFDTARKAIDSMVANRGKKEYLRIVFFGGEPLLNFELIKQVLVYCSRLEEQENIKFGYSMTTNGTILNDEIVDYIKKYRISVMISMDGGEKTQNCYRCYANGEGSFDVIKNNIDRFKETQGGNITVRATICKPNIDMVAIREELMKLGFCNVIMSMVDTSSNSPLFLGNETENMINEYSRLADVLIKEAKEGNDINNVLFKEILRMLYYKSFNVKGCNAGSTGFAIGSDGNYYPCHRYMGMEDYICGNVEEGIDLEKTKIFLHANVFEKEDCKDCWARFLCGGACSNTCVSQSGDVMKAPISYCNIYKGIYENALYIYYELKEWDDNYLRKLLDKDNEAVAIIK